MRAVSKKINRKKIYILSQHRDGGIYPYRRDEIGRVLSIFDSLEKAKRDATEWGSSGRWTTKSAMANGGTATWERYVYSYSSESRTRHLIRECTNVSDIGEISLRDINHTVVKFR